MTKTPTLATRTCDYDHCCQVAPFVLEALDDDDLGCGLVACRAHLAEMIDALTRPPTFRAVSVLRF